MSSSSTEAAATNEVTECPKCSSKRLITYAEERKKQQCYNCKFFVFTDGRRWDIAPEDFLKDEVTDDLVLPDNIVKAVAHSIKPKCKCKCKSREYNVTLTLADGSEVVMVMNGYQLESRKKTLEEGRILRYVIWSHRV